MRTLIIIALLLVFSCRNETKSEFTTGIWRGYLELQDKQKLPFIFSLNTDSTLVIHNSEERIEVDEVTFNKDSFVIKLPVFEGFIKGRFSQNSMDGVFVKEGLNQIVPFKAIAGDSTRFHVSPSVVTSSVHGNWQANFSPGTSDHYVAQGIFKQKENKVFGTFRTTTGDYRYLEGVVDGDSLRLSTFDGAHAFLFTAKISDSVMNGYFYSGNHWKEPWTAVRNKDYELPDAESLTYIRDGFQGLQFSFPDNSGAMHSLSDPRFRNKVVVVQVMGTWCPNCLDETRFLSAYYEANKNRGIEVIALAFEYAKTPEKAFANISRLRDRVGITYPVLLAQYGSADKKLAAEKLPMLNHVLSYPTTIFVDKTGSVRKIHTGFNGPATGEKYTEFQVSFHRFIEKLLSE